MADDKPYAYRSLVRSPNGYMRLVMIDERTGLEIPGDLWDNYQVRGIEGAYDTTETEEDTTEDEDDGRTDIEELVEEYEPSGADQSDRGGFESLDGVDYDNDGAVDAYVDPMTGEEVISDVPRGPEAMYGFRDKIAEVVQSTPMARLADTIAQTAADYLGVEIDTIRDKEEEEAPAIEQTVEEAPVQDTANVTNVGAGVAQPGTAIDRGPARDITPDVSLDQEVAQHTAQKAAAQQAAQQTAQAPTGPGVGLPAEATISTITPEIQRDPVSRTTGVPSTTTAPVGTKTDKVSTVKDQSRVNPGLTTAQVNAPNVGFTAPNTTAVAPTMEGFTGRPAGRTADVVEAPPTVNNVSANVDLGTALAEKALSQRGAMGSTSSGTSVSTSGFGVGSAGNRGVSERGSDRSSFGPGVSNEAVAEAYGDYAESRGGVSAAESAFGDTGSSASSETYGGSGGSDYGDPDAGGGGTSTESSTSDGGGYEGTHGDHGDDAGGEYY